MKQKLNLEGIAIFCESEEEKRLAGDLFQRFSPKLIDKSLWHTWRTAPYVFIKGSYFTGTDGFELRNKNKQVVKFKDLVKSGFKIPKIKVPKWKKIWRFNE